MVRLSSKYVSPLHVLSCEFAKISQPQVRAFVTYLSAKIIVFVDSFSLNVS